MQHKKYKKIVLVILDGFGVAPKSFGNAITSANISNFDYIVSNFPALTLQASGPLVGLPWGEMGNSETGHLNIGAGRIVGQDLPRITYSIQSGEFFKNEAFLGAIEHAKKNHSALHIMGMISPGGVHSLDEHFFALLGLAQQKGLNNVFIHMFTDGRDTDPKIALETVKKLQNKINEIGVGVIASVSGRFYAMDRGGHWAQTALAYNAIVKGQGPSASSAEEIIRNSYAKQIFDEMIEPTVVINSKHEPVGKVLDNDAVIFANFRQDRAIQLTQAFVRPDTLPEKFIEKPLQNLFFVTMTKYRNDLPTQIAFPQSDLKNYLAETLSKAQYSQFHIAESEKYAHVTAFLNCGNSEKSVGEEWVIIPSPQNGRNYVDEPEMSAGKLTETLVEKITKTDTKFFIANYANPDMVGHTGNMPATVKAVTYINDCIKKILDACLAVDAVLMITSDHGNAEQMINTKTGDIDTDHTTNPVPFLIASGEFKFKKPISLRFADLAARTPSGVISDIAPTVLELFGLDKPSEMTGVSLLDEIDVVPVRH